MACGLQANGSWGWPKWSDDPLDAHRSGGSGSLADASPGHGASIGRRRRAAVGMSWSIIGMVPGASGASQAVAGCQICPCPTKADSGLVMILGGGPPSPGPGSHSSVMRPLANWPGATHSAGEGKHPSRCDNAEEKSTMPPIDQPGTDIRSNTESVPVPSPMVILRWGVQDTRPIHN